MAGKHEPVSKRSFYLSLTTAALRGLLVITALVLGVFVLSRAFPTAGEVPLPQGQGSPQGGASPTTPDSPDPTTSVTPVEPLQPSPQVEGVVVQVLNGTDVEGLAASTATKLERRGYVVPDDGVGDATDFYEITTIFFKRDSKLEAEHLRDTLFPGAELQRSPADASPVFQLTLVVGSDHAESEDLG